MNKKKQVLNDELLQSINEEHPDTNNYLIPNEITKKVKSLTSIKWDLADAHAALTKLSVKHLMGNKEETIMTALWKSAIITYGKCFTNSDDGQSKLEVKDSFKSMSISSPFIIL